MTSSRSNKTAANSPPTTFGKLIMFLILGVTSFAICSYVTLFSQVPEASYLRKQVEELQRAMEEQKTIINEHVHKHRRNGIQQTNTKTSPTSAQELMVVDHQQAGASRMDRRSLAYLAKAAAAKATQPSDQSSRSSSSSSSSKSSSSSSSGGSKDINDLLGMDTILLVVCSNRPDYLTTTLEHVVKYHPRNSVPIFVSEDGNDPTVGAVISSAQQALHSVAPTVPFLHRHHVRDPQVHMENGYFMLADHFKWALTEIFSGKDLGLPSPAQRVIILEEDLKIAPDFFDFFAAMVTFVDHDETVLCASAWNDNGMGRMVQDPQAVYRSDFFPGLGWMMGRKIWEELAPKWPKAYWDDWLREPPQRKGRHILRPEICRTFHFGMKGVSHAQFSEFLTGIRLNDAANTVHFADHDLSYLSPTMWDKEYLGSVRQARKCTMNTFDTVRQEVIRGSGLAARGSGLAKTAGLCIEYQGIEEYDPASFVAVAHWAGCMDNIKANVPRTAYKGIVSLWKDGVKLHIAPQGTCGVSG